MGTGLHQAAEGLVHEDYECVGEQHPDDNHGSCFALFLLCNKQGTHIYRYRPRNLTGKEQGKEPSCSPPCEKPPGASKHRRDSTEPKKTIAGSQPYWQGKAFSPSKPRAVSKALSSLPESQKAAEEMRTPLGIPLSKLSQSKHLKNKVTAAPGATDSKKKPPEPTSQKEQ